MCHSQNSSLWPGARLLTALSGFGDLAAAFRGEDLKAEPTLGEVGRAFRRHAELMVEFWSGDEGRACRDMRKHVAWYFKGYPVGGEVRAALALADSLQQIDDLLATMDPDERYPGEAAEGPRGRAGSAHHRAPPAPLARPRDVVARAPPARRHRSAGPCR